MGLESRQGLAECLWLRGSHEKAVKVSAKAVVCSEGSLGVREVAGYTSTLIHMAVGRPQKSYLHTQGCLMA